MQARNLLRLAAFTGDDRYRRRADRLFTALAGPLAEAPAAFPAPLVALDARLAKRREIVLVVPRDRDQARPFLAHLRRRFLPQAVLCVVRDRDVERAAEVLPLVAGKRAFGGRATAFVCEGHRCQLPTADPEVFAAQLDAPR